MESQAQNPEFRNNPENFHPCTFVQFESRTEVHVWSLYSSPPKGQ